MGNFVADHKTPDIAIAIHEIAVGVDVQTLRLNASGVRCSRRRKNVTFLPTLQRDFGGKFRHTHFLSPFRLTPLIRRIAVTKIASRLCRPARNVMNAAVSLHTAPLPFSSDLLAWTTPDIAVRGYCASTTGPASAPNIP